MKYFDFMEAQYAKKSIENQVKYDSWSNAEAKAAHTLIGFQRTIYTYIHYFLLMVRFGLMIAGITEPPQCADDFIKEYQAKTQKDKPSAAVTPLKPVS